MRLDATRASLIVFALFAAGVLGGATVGSLAAERSRDPYAPLDTLVRVMALVQTTWVDEVTTEELVAGAIDGMIARLDPHSVWMDATTWRDVQRETHGSFTGIGVEVRLTDEGARIVRVLPGSPASRDGLVVGDLILSVDGRRLRASDLHDAQSALLGPRGERARLEVLRSGWEGPRTVETVRDEVHAPAVSGGRLDDRTAYVRVTQFQQGAATELRQVLDRLGPFDGLVLDLRDNPGGLLREAVEVVDLFLEAGTIVSTWGRLASERAVHEATPGALDVPLVVLVDGGSASAAEIVAGALQDTGRALLVGTRTYGKGSVQTVFEHRDGSALKLTIGRYLTPSGQPVAPREGRVPDVVVAPPEQVTPAARLREAITGLDVPQAERGRLLELVDRLPHAEVRAVRAERVFDRPLTERLSDDPQLRAALDLLRVSRR